MTTQFIDRQALNDQDLQVAAGGLHRALLFIGKRDKKDGVENGSNAAHPL